MSKPSQDDGRLHEHLEVRKERRLVTYVVVPFPLTPSSPLHGVVSFPSTGCESFTWSVVSPWSGRLCALDLVDWEFLVQWYLVFGTKG